MLLHNIFITSKGNSIYIQKYKKRETIINFIDRISNKKYILTIKNRGDFNSCG